MLGKAFTLGVEQRRSTGRTITDDTVTRLGHDRVGGGDHVDEGHLGRRRDDILARDRPLRHHVAQARRYRRQPKNA